MLQSSVHDVPRPRPMPEIDRTMRELVRFQPSHVVLSYWTEAVAEAVPDRAPDFEPLDVSRIWPHLYLLEKIGDRMRYRVSGSAVNALFNSEHTGRFLDDVVQRDIYEVVSPFFRRVFDGVAVIFTGNLVLPSKHHVQFERVLLPVRRNRTTLLLGCLSLSTNAELVDDKEQSPPPEPGFHFHLFDPRTGEASYAFHDSTPLLQTDGARRRRLY